MSLHEKNISPIFPQTKKFKEEKVKGKKKREHTLPWIKVEPKSFEERRETKK